VNKVLDNGYVELKDVWGSDERIIESARMSSGKGFLGWGTPEKPGDEKLLKYLWKNKHTSPFEQCGLTVEVQAPIMVFREWHRHRTQCLRGNTIIDCVMPNGTINSKTIKEIFDLKYGGVIDSAPEFHKNGHSKAGTAVLRKARRKNPWRTRVLPNCQDRTLRVLNEDTGFIETGKMKAVWESGIKPIFCLSIPGYERSIYASEDHFFYTKDGWKKLKDLVIGDYVATRSKVAAHARPLPPSLRTGIGIWTSMMRNRLINDIDSCYICRQRFVADELELDHVIPVIQDLKLALDEANLKPICKACHLHKTANEQPERTGMTRLGIKWVEVISKPFYVCDEMTYDIEVEDPHHNFIANGFIVHNSYNEMSGRYTQIPDIHYLPEPSRVKAQSKANKQGTGDQELPPEIVAEFLSRIKAEQEQIYATYQWALDHNISREVARINTPISRYSRMVASANLLNWLKFLTLRMPEAAQYEIRQYANEVAKIVAEKFPRTWELFINKEV
jgi:thymidylate synthase (FAD)